MTEMIYPEGKMMPSGEKKVSYSYDAANRLTSVTDWNGNETIYEYDGSGELVSITYPDGSIEFREYDSAGQLSQTYRCEKDSSNTIEHNQYEYDRDGLMLREEIEENSAVQRKISEMQYDDLGRLKYRTSSVGASDKANVTEETFYIDAAGNILTCDITKNGNSSENLLRDMEYDEQNKLIRTGDKKLWYDEDGNMLGIDDITTEKAVNSISIEKNSTNAIAKSAVKNSPSWTGISANKAAYRKKVPEKKESTTEAEGAGSDDEEASGDDSEDHQNDEQQVSAISEDGSYEEYYYDSSNHLLSAEATEYGYDAEENRYGTYERTTGKESLYTYADTPYGTQLVISETSTGEKQNYIYGNGLISSTDGYGMTAIYHYDYRGSTTSLTDTEGNIIAAYSYGTYGDCTKEEVAYTSDIFGQDEEVDTIFRYNGRDGVVTDSNGMYYMRSRYYSPYLKPRSCGKCYSNAVSVF